MSPKFIKLVIFLFKKLFGRSKKSNFEHYVDLISKTRSGHVRMSVYRIPPLYIVERRLKEARKKLERRYSSIHFWKKMVERRKLRKKEIKIRSSQIERSFFVI